MRTNIIILRSGSLDVLHVHEIKKIFVFIYFYFFVKNQKSKHSRFKK